MSDQPQAPAHGEVISDVIASIANPSAANILNDIALVISIYQDIKAKLGNSHPSVVSILKLLLSEL